ncbi:protein sidekick-1-like [Myotis lucifugus]|uniref:protein sidekick-1-like n=1 Tax=Myotis lucifugus TaxID=59463 RepID=UPI000CCC202B|nr:protein sidekick-1-like [Myotis lucifugus]
MGANPATPNLSLLGPNVMIKNAKDSQSPSASSRELPPSSNPSFASSFSTELLEGSWDGTCHVTGAENRVEPGLSAELGPNEYLRLQGLTRLRLQAPRAPLMGEDVVPYFKTEPGLPQTHLEGNRLVLTCLAEGSWPLEFRWLRNDSEVTAYSSEYRYVIPALRQLDAGFYRCAVRNRLGALLQRRSEVHVAYMGSFLAGEQRKTVPEGQAAILDLPPLRSYPRPQVTWFREGHKIIPSDRIGQPASTPTTRAEMERVPQRHSGRPDFHIPPHLVGVPSCGFTGVPDA